MKKDQAILKRQASKIKFRNKDMDFILNWVMGISQIVGMSAAEVLQVVEPVRDGNPRDWRQAFEEHASVCQSKAHQAENQGFLRPASQEYFAACYSLRAALQFSDPTLPDFMEHYQEMEANFLKGAKLRSLPLREVSFPYEGQELPAYLLESKELAAPTLLVIGGGDTGRVDLFYFMGLAAWENGYQVLMVDLPGQGSNPARGLTFTVDAGRAISAILDSYQAPSEQLAIMGFSGGGYFTAQAVEKDSRIKAWIASTPIYDIKAVFERSFKAALTLPKPLLRLGCKVISNFNEAADVNLKKYAWQFGVTDFSQAVDKVLKEAQTVALEQIKVPSLFLLGSGESSELSRQAREIEQNLQEAQISVTVQEFDLASAADAHCQVNNLRLLHNTVLDWLDKIFKQNHEERK
ncbi:alpha/beta hydrolase family protein [Streptococcus massiliensis]|uniref:Alpha/beta fold family hydrolase n=1 Tax=Streptococcus massiliensis TaxID=313439 RepID=A0A380KZW6_9STRE|nr:alpha/beta fold hydrolase [Streptococcus massiliensis]SUN77544.1 alpha/beta fold family hydrolase [Streptococcus massiliensis]